MSASVSHAPNLPPKDDPIESEPAPVDHDMADGQDTDDESTDSDHDQPQPQPVPPIKRYSPPKPDGNTFETQQAFLDSLEAIDIEDVDKESCKCPICWKPFGEKPDPGFDNSEVPVQLRCKHIFGNKCLTSLFGVRNGCGITLQPLQFSPDKKGHLLGELLLQYHQKHIFNFRNETEMFENLLQHQDHHSERQRCLGEYWTTIIHIILHQTYDLTDIIFMENAVILDHYPIKPQKSTGKSEAPHMQFLTDVGKSVDPTMVPMPSLLTGDPYTMPMAVPTISHSNTKGASTLPSGLTYTPPQLTPGEPQSYHSFLSEEVKLQLLSTPSSSDLSKTWQVALANETNLDKLSTLQKQFNDAMVSKMSKEKVEVLKLQAAREEQRKKQAQIIREATERRARDRKVLLARKLAQVLSQYKTHNAASSDLDLRQGTHPLDKTPTHIQTKVSIHATNVGETSYAIPQPWTQSSMDDEDDVDHEATAKEIAKSTMIVVRSYCHSCLPDESDAPIPTELTWKPLEKVPDDCPLCHKILFKKASAQQWNSD